MKERRELREERVQARAGGGGGRVVGGPVPLQRAIDQQRAELKKLKAEAAKSGGKGVGERGKDGPPGGAEAA
eukprot:2313071-Lingulodinium_polyedra.AAC.1